MFTSRKKVERKKFAIIEDSNLSSDRPDQCAAVTPDDK